MLIFAWIVLVLSALTLILSIIFSIVICSGKLLLCGICPKLFEISGCLWYIFGFTFLPYSLIIGAALGTTLLSSIAMINWLVTEEFFERKFIWPHAIPTFATFVFFVLASVQHLWPHLITF